VKAVTARRRTRRILLGLLAVTLVGALVGGLAAAGGTYDRYARAALLDPALRARAPGWTRPCWALARYVVAKPFCVHLDGRVAWVQKHDSDGDGDRHLLVVERFHLRIVKLTVELPVQRLPRLGAHVEVTGWLMKGGSGRDEIDTQRLVTGGRTYLTKAARG
jgi:hypothetical protein